eukprot:m.110516 g.110516  ORF g.110516 m.110516 type:complete len:701 (-) comp15917_c0_seq1:1262-3364(-)
MAETEVASPTEETSQQDFDIDLNLGNLDLTSQDFDFDEVGGHIQENLEDETVKEALQKGLDLRVYARQIEEDLMKVEQESLDDYIAEAVNMAALHSAIQECDFTLQQMENLLGTFQADLGNISEEIQNLQDQSLSMNQKLKNRKVVQERVGAHVQALSISPDLVDAICNEQVGDKFQEALGELHTKLTFAGGLSPDVKSITDVSVDLEKLKMKAVTKIRESCMQKIGAMKKPMSNPQLQQNALLKQKPSFEFVVKHHRQIAAEIRDEYIDTMGKVQLTYFKTYLARLLKLQYEEVPDKDDLLGTEDTVKRGFFSSKPSLKSRSTTFTIGDRGKVLQELESPILVPLAVKERDDIRLPYERIFRSFQYALLDNCAREFLFCSEFFSVKDARAYEFFKTVMGKTLALLQKHIETYVQTTYDSISLVLCARICSAYEDIMNKKNIPCLQPYFESCLEMIWPRFTTIINLNTESVKLTDPQKLAAADTRPHYIVRRYAEYSGALLSLQEGKVYEQVTTGLDQLREEVENFILRMAAEFPGRKEQLIFLINNYDMMLSVYQEHLHATQGEAIRIHLKVKTQEFVEEELSPHIGGLMAFVKQTELQLKRSETINVDPKRVQALISGFAKDWKVAIASMNEDVMRAFTNFKNGTVIIESILTQFVDYYDRFLALLKLPAFKRTTGTWTDLVGQHNIIVEIKKHRTTF